MTALVAAAVFTGCVDGSDEPETLESFLGFGGDREAMMAQAEVQQRELEEEVAACMADEGFEYVPQDFGSMMPAGDPRQDLSEEEFRAEYGYGISTIDRSERQLTAPEDDPNLAIQQKMDDAEREAYQRALDGEMPEFDPGGDPQEQVFEPGGCRGHALQSVHGERMAAGQELTPAILELEEQVASDPRMVDAEREWQACMSEAGLDYSDRFGPQRDISDRFHELQSAAFEAVDPEELAATGDGDELPELPAIDDEALEELRTEELEVAAVEGMCTHEHLDEVEAEVRADYEGEFIDEHRELLEQIRPDRDG